MSAIQSSVGLITGIPIQDTVDQLIQLSSRPRDTLATRTAGIQAEQGAVDTLASLVLSLQFSTNRFSAASTFNGRNATSSSDAVSVSVSPGESPAPGNFQFTPLQTASAQQFVSSAFSDITEAIGDGELRFRFGGRVDQGVDLSELNGGSGVSAGQIRITDRSGASALVDLRAAQTVDDVLQAINASVDVSVTATAVGDAFTLTDNTGGTGLLSVQDVGIGTTAADLGLDNLSTNDESLTGADVFDLSESTTVASLNNGTGVRTIAGADDLSITLRDGTTFGVDLSGAEDLSDILAAINDDEDNGGLLSASVNAGGDGLLLTDTTGGSGNLIVGNTTASLGSAADDLGIVTDAVGVASDTVDGDAIVAGLGDTLVSSLNGGRGFTLGSIAINTRTGDDISVDLSGAETLGDIVTLLDGASDDVSASVNAAGNGIVITDNTGGTENLTIADVGPETTATDLGLAIDAAQDSVGSGSLNRQAVSEATLLASLNGGEGVAIGDFFVTDSAGDRQLIELDPPSDSRASTVGDVIDRINAAGNGVLASINATGDGILLTDTAGGSGTLTVTEAGGGSTAADLNLIGASDATDSENRQTIDGSTSFAVDLSDLEQSPTDISLSTLNGGSGVGEGIFDIVAADGNNFTVDFRSDPVFTVGDVIDRINTAAAGARSGQGIAVTAALNSAGTGIELTDATTPDNGGVLTVEDLAGTAAADLNLAGESTTTNGNGQQTLNGRGLFAAIDPDQGALETVAERINALGAGVTASVLSDSRGFRLAISVNEPGAGNEIVIDSGSSGLAFQQTSRATDAVALFGPASAGGGIAVTSTDNQFNGVVDGLDITVNQANGETATLDVSTDESPFIDAVQEFVDSYNSVRANLDTVTAFNEESFTTGILFGRVEALRVDTDLGRVVSSSLIFGARFGSLESVGVSLENDGTLSLDRGALSDAFASDPLGVERLFTDENNGLVAELTSAIDRLAGEENSLLSARSAALTETIDVNNARIEQFNLDLENERESLLLEFFRLEETIALLQSNLSTISGIQAIPPLSFNRGNSN